MLFTFFGLIVSPFFVVYATNFLLAKNPMSPPFLYASLWPGCFTKTKQPYPSKPSRAIASEGDRWANPELDRISTSYVESQNLIMRMGIRRFTRLTNGFSKKVEFHAHAVSLNFMYYNLARPHRDLRVKNANDTYTTRTPAMADGIASHIRLVQEIAALLDSN